MKKTLLAGVALAILSAASASAADLPRAVKAPMPAPVSYAQPIALWTGGYIGVAGGYAFNDRLGTSTTAGGLLPAASFAAGLHPEGGFFGGQVGYNWQVPNSMFVLGIEGDMFLSDISDSRTISNFGPVAIGASSKLDKFGTVRGRVGVAVDQALFYATGGLAVGYNIASLDVAAFGTGARVFDSQTHVGWTVGGGVEYAVTRNWSAKVEYRYMDLESKTYNFVPGVLSVDVKPSFHTVSAGINYKF